MRIRVRMWERNCREMKYVTEVFGFGLGLENFGEFVT